MVEASLGFGIHGFRFLDWLDGGKFVMALGSGTLGTMGGVLQIPGRAGMVGAGGVGGGDVPTVDHVDSRDRDSIEDQQAWRNR